MASEPNIHRQPVVWFHSSAAEVVGAAAVAVVAAVAGMVAEPPALEAPWKRPMSWSPILSSEPPAMK